MQVSFVIPFLPGLLGILPHKLSFQQNSGSYALKLNIA